MNIFDITQEIEKLEKLLSETDFNEEIESAINAKTEMLEQLKKDFENKVLAYRHIFKKYDNDKILIDNEIERLKNHKYTIEQRQVKILDTICTVFELKGIEKKEYPTGEKISFRNITRYEYNEDELKELGYFKEKKEITLDKEKAKKDFKIGTLKTGIKENKEKILTIK